MLHSDFLLNKGFKCFVFCQNVELDMLHLSVCFQSSYDSSLAYKLSFNFVGQNLQKVC